MGKIAPDLDFLGPNDSKVIMQVKRSIWKVEQKVKVNLQITGQYAQIDHNHCTVYSGGRWSGLCLFLYFGCQTFWWECHGFWRCFLGFLYINFTKIPFLAQKNWCNQVRWRHLWLRIFKKIDYFLKIVFWTLLLILAKK